MKDFSEVVKAKTIPTTFVFRCQLCGFEVTDFDRHFGLIKMNQHIKAVHGGEVRSLDMEDLYSRKLTVVLEEF